ncbi:hypothetical protein J2X61_003658 [Bacillus sp. 3255]|nr:hypothetical protein [Bacillus sp. 3255]
MFISPLLRTEFIVTITKKKVCKVNYILVYNDTRIIWSILSTVPVKEVAVKFSLN